MSPVMFTLLHVNGAVAEGPALGRRNVGGGRFTERLMWMVAVLYGNSGVIFFLVLNVFVLCQREEGDA